MTGLFRLDRVKVLNVIGSAVGSCDVYAESGDDARSQAAAEFGVEWLDPDQVTCRQSMPLTASDEIPAGMREIKRSG
jgi:hypothetical protein